MSISYSDDHEVIIKEGNVITVVRDDRSLEEAKVDMVTYVDNYRDEKLGFGVIFGGVIFDTREIDRQNFTGAVAGVMAQMAFGMIPGNISWITRGNEGIILTPQELVMIGLGVADYIGRVYVSGRKHKDAVLSMTNIYDIDTYDFKEGWPSNNLGGHIKSLDPYS